MAPMRDIIKKRLMKKPISGISLGDIHLTAFLGEGGFGAVFNGTVEGLSQKDVAVKVVSATTATIRATVLREVEILKIIPIDDHLIQYFGHCESSGFCYIVMELGVGGLDSIIEFGLEIAEWVEILDQICAGIVSLHELKIAHRDLKVENVIYTLSNFGEKIFKLIDFGLSTMDDFVGDCDGGSEPYSAPETFSSAASVRYDPLKADIWSLAILSCKLICLDLWESANEKDSDYIDFALQVNPAVRSTVEEFRASLNSVTGHHELMVDHLSDTISEIVSVASEEKDSNNRISCSSLNDYLPPPTGDFSAIRTIRQFSDGSTIVIHLDTVDNIEVESPLVKSPSLKPQEPIFVLPKKKKTLWQRVTRFFSKCSCGRLQDVN
ncbi:hypothetical protein HDU79_000300 [Rhizoclosmatium sp. JEL0117]|nr:hypothetical protein HDU79_000300 [Rhizoclosmatium sp. JEL0117]